MPKAPSPIEIREQFSDYSSDWKDIKEEGRIDVQYASGDPWDPEDRKAREDAGRPCISLDEITQYLNQAINNVRQNKRAVQVNPKGSGATDKDAERRGDIIRGIEYRSNAQSAYITAFENALQRSYGFAALRTEYDEDGFNQHLVIKRISNPDSVLIASDFDEADAHDMTACFWLNVISKKDFKRQYKGAKVTDFDSEQMQEAPNWIRDKDVQIAEFWKVNTSFRKMLLIDTPEGHKSVYEDELSKRDDRGRFTKRGDLKILKERDCEKREVVQYITNGLEILEENPWAGSRIPILPCFGKELFIDEGGGAKRVLLSMVRLARDAQMLHAYLASQEAEEAGLAPKSPFVGYKGQFESDSEAWETATKVAHAMLQVDPVVDSASGQVLPLPTRPAFQPNFQAYEVAKESSRRSIQSAMGISPLPTAAQRQNEKSGIALQHIATQEAIGAFHFTDNYDLFLQNAGWQMNELLGPIYDTARDVPVTTAKQTHETVRINDPGYAEQNPDKAHLDTQSGDFDVTISTGPSYQSQRDIASQFVDTLLQNLQSLPVAPPVSAKILSLAIKLKSLGPIGDEIADLLSPPDQNGMPPQAQAAIAQAQGQVQELQSQLQQLTMEKQAKTVEKQFDLQIASVKSQGDVKLKLLDNEVKLAVAEIGAKSQDVKHRQQLDADLDSKLQDHAHEAEMSAMEHNQGTQLAAQQADAAAQAQAADQSHDQSMADQGHAQTLEQQQQAAELAPQPDTEDN